MNKTGIIYKAISPSGKVYIGKTIETLSRRKNRHYSNSFNKNYAGYNRKISYAIRKYDKNIKWIVIHFNVPLNDLNRLEIEEIKKHNSFHHGYNGTEGGEGSIGRQTSRETREKISEANKGKKHSKEFKNKISEHRKGKSHSIEIKKKISKAVSGKNNGMAKLNWEIVQEIRLKYSTKQYTYKKLAKEYKVSDSTIGDIIRNVLWKL